MVQQLILTLIILVVSLPVVFVCKEGKAVGFNRNVLLFSLYHVCYVMLIYLPIMVAELSISGSSMNWTGKILGVIFSIAVLIGVKNTPHFKNYVTGPKLGETLKKTFMVGGIALITMCLLTIVFSHGKETNAEKLAYQLTMPGLDEELWRGILLGFLVLVLKPRKYKLGHPALWATTLIFALGHSLYLEDWRIGFALDAFIITGALGYVLGWMTLRNKSILLALVFHNLINFSTNFIEMYVL